MKRHSELVKELKEQMRQAAPPEVEAKAREVSEQLARLRFQMASGQSDVLQKIRDLRKDLARLKTILREREVEPAGEKSS